MNRRAFLIELPEADYEKLDNIVNSGKYASKVDFIRTAIRQAEIRGIHNE